MTETTKIRVLLADDHALLRAGLRVLLNSQPDLEVVGEAGNLQETLIQARALHPDVVTLDLSMPGTNSMELLEHLRKEFPQVPVLVLTMHDDPAYLRAALGAGASGYLVKTAAETELLSAIRAVHAGRTFIDLKLNETLLKTVFGDPGTRAEGPGLPQEMPLSPRESEVLKFLALGYTHQQIADYLYLSTKTVETYRARIAEKLGLRSRADLIRYALDTGLLSPGKPMPRPPLSSKTGEAKSAPKR
ncbi:MAG: response regulator transcription factor [Planctomycetes bacterium]|nr:response regulator transcription factor [Planctomycetota bacterium]